MKNVTSKKPGTKKGSAKKVVNNTPATISGRTRKQLEATANYNADKAGSWDALLQSGRDADLENLSFSKKINHYIDCATARLKGIVSDENLAKITFGNVKKWKDESVKYQGLDYVSTHQAKLIVNGYIKSIDGNVSRGERVAKQGGVTGKNADVQTRRSKANAK